MAKRYTVLILPQDHTKVKKFAIPRFLLNAFVFLFGLSTLILSWIVYDYTRIRQEVGEVYRLEAENKSQKIQLQSFANKIGELELQMAKLNQFDWKLRNITNLNPPTDPDRIGTIFGLGGPSPGDDLLLLGPDNYEEDIVTEGLELKISRLEEETLNQEKSFNELHEYFLGQKALLVSTPSVWPTKGWLASGFGYRISPFTGLRDRHEGIDIANRMGTPVIATADGNVVKTGNNWALGKYLIIDHGYGFKTKFGHLSKIFVKRGQKVKRGEKIASMGNTGKSTGFHLHYEVLVRNKPMNPMRYILN